MTPAEAELAKAEGITATAHKWIKKIEVDWEATLATGRDRMWIESLNNEVAGVQKIVVDYFVSLGYGFKEECDRSYYNDTWHYRMRMLPLEKPKKELGIFSRLFTRLFGGHA